MFYYEGFDHANSSDKEETVIEIESSEEEPKRIIVIGITAVSNAGYLSAYVRREQVMNGIPTEGMNIQNVFEIPVDIELPVGQKFKLTLKNKVAGTNAGIRGYVKYEITA